MVGKTKEVQVAGGEVAFAKKMVEESRALLDKVRIYTVLLGHKSSVAEVKKVLHTTPEVTSLTSTQFCQGKTMRWGVAWTFVPGIDLRSVQSVKAKKNKEKPFIWLVPRKEKKERNAGRTYGMIAPWLRDLEIETEVGLSSQHLCTVRLTARKKTWMKQRRKRREEARTDKIGGQEDLDPESALIAEQQERNKARFHPPDVALLPSWDPRAPGFVDSLDSGAQWQHRGQSLKRGRLTSKQSSVCTIDKHNS